MPYDTGHFGLAHAFMKQLKAVKSGAALRRLMEGVTSELGYRHFAIIEHSDLRAERSDLVALHSYPPVWADYFIQRQLYVSDPVVHACFRTSHAFAWSELADLIRLNKLHHAILEGAAREGLIEGVTTPWFRPGLRCGSCSFGGVRRGCSQVECPLIIQAIGSFAYSKAATLVGADMPIVSGKPRLTPRERECVILTSHGKSNLEIAMILGIAHRTARQHIDNAMRAYDVVNRAQLVVAALLDGEIHLTEIAEGLIGF